MRDHLLSYVELRSTPILPQNHRMKKYTVRKGRHRFSPGRFWPCFLSYGTKVLKWRFKLSASCWYDSLGVDNRDINKLGGITRSSSPNNVDSLLIGWRPLENQPGFFEIFVYENIGTANVPREADPRIVQADEEFEIILVPGLKQPALYHIYFKAGLSLVHWGDSAFRRHFSLFRLVNLWFGGNRTSPQSMDIEAQFWTEDLQQAQ